MAQPRDVKTAFESLISDNKIVIDKIDGALDETRRFRSPARAAYDEKIGSFVQGIVQFLDSGALASLSALRKGTGFEQEFHGRKLNSMQVAQKFNALELTHGTPAQVAEKASDTNKTLNGQDLFRIRLQARKDNVIDKSLAGVDAFNAKALQRGKLQLSEEAVGYFHSKKGLERVWAYLFDSHYRGGRKLAKRNFAKEKGEKVSLVDMLKQRADNAANIAAASAQVASLREELKSLNQILDDMKKLSKSVETDEAIRADIAAKIIRLLDDKDVFSAAAKALDGQMPTAAVETRAKVESYLAIEQGLEQRREVLVKANAKMERSLPNLRTAVWNGVSQHIAIDLAGLKGNLQAQQVMATHVALEMRKANKVIHDTVPSRSSFPVADDYSDPFALYMRSMMWSMMTAEARPDAHAVNMVMGIPADVAQDANLDVEKLAPCFSADVVQELNGLSGDLGQCDMSALENLSVPDVAVDIGTTDFSVPDVQIDTSSVVDSWSSSSDSGGSVSFDP